MFAEFYHTNINIKPKYGERKRRGGTRVRGRETKIDGIQCPLACSSLICKRHDAGTYRAREAESNGFVPMFLNPLLKGTFYFTTYGRSPGREGNEEGDRGLSIQLIRNLSQTDCEGHIVPRGAERAVAERGRRNAERKKAVLFVPRVYLDASREGKRSETH